MKNIILSRPQRELLDTIIMGRGFIPRHERTTASVLQSAGLIRTVERSVFTWLVAPTELGREWAAMRKRQIADIIG